MHQIQITKMVAKRLVDSYITSPGSKLAVKFGITPNVLTLLALPVSVSSAYLLGLGYFAAGGAILLLSSSFDLLDGAVARATRRVTKFGAFLDSNVDRVAESVVLLGLLVYYLRNDSVTEMVLGVILVYISVVSSMMVSYARARAEGLEIDCSVGLMTRPERIVVLSIGLIVGQLWWPAVLISLGAIFILSTVTTVQRIFHARLYLSSWDESVATDLKHDRDVA